MRRQPAIQELERPFLTELDSRAAIKGSRDPLGVQSIWSRLGRQVVGNLTTVSNSIRDFKITLLGYWFVEQVAEAEGSEGDLATFLKWEQLAAYARASVLREKRFRGTERVWRRMSEADRVWLGTESRAQILSNQRIYGLWGLYTMPSKASGLLEGNPTQLTPVSRKLVEQDWVPKLAAVTGKGGKAIVERLRDRDAQIDLRPKSKDTAILSAVAQVLKRVGTAERRVFCEHLVDGGPIDADPERGTLGCQRVFGELLKETLVRGDWVLSPQSIEALMKRAERRGAAGIELAQRLAKIRAAELLLAPAAAFFEHVLGSDGQSPAKIDKWVRGHWGNALRDTIEGAAVEALKPELRWTDDDEAMGARWVELAHAFRAADYERAVHLVLQQNEAVMTARAAAAPWATIRDGRIQVRFRDGQLGVLPAAEELPGYWRHAYFIESLRSVARDLHGA